MAVTVYILEMVLAGVLAFALYNVFSWVKTYKKRWAMFKQFPQDPAHPIFGHLLAYPGPNEAGLAFMRDSTSKHPTCALYWNVIGLAPMLIVHHPDTLKVILKSSEPKGSRVYNLIRPWIGDGLLTSKGGKWTRNRRLLTPAFFFDILKNYISMKNACAEDILAKFQTAADTGQPFTVFANVAMFTLDVMLRCAMSYKTDCQKNGEKHPYVQAVHSLSELLVARFFKPWLHQDIVYFMTPDGWKFLKNCNLVHKVAEDIIKKRREKLKGEGLNTTQGIKRPCLDFLDTLLTAKDENGMGLTDAEIRDEVDTFLFEGHDTTASAISWALYSIAEHEHIQKRIQEELDNLMDGRDSPDILWEDLSKLPYLTMVIKEALRVHTPVPFIQRELTVDTEIDGKVLPAGSMISILLYNAHHNSSIWEDSLTFDPERFLPENVEKRSSYAFVPFSAGPRNCIGQNFAMDEIKICLARILHRFSIRLDSTQKVEKILSIVMRAKEDIRLFVTDRRATS